MKKVLPLLLLLLPLSMLAQERGVQFDHTSTWQEIQARAKAEHKYIFMDCFTTWCGPCRYMAANVFTQDKVGDFFNKNFISVKVQLDVKDNDAAFMKQWAQDVKAIGDVYRIPAFPTFFFFSPEGKVVYRLVGGNDADQFLARSADALDPTKQFYTLMDQYNADSTHKGPADFRNLAIAAQKTSNELEGRIFAEKYLETQKDLTTDENIRFLASFTNNSKDKGFPIFLNQAAKVDAVMGPGTAENLVKEVVRKEEIHPLIPRGKSTGKPDWKAMRDAVTKKYPAYADELVLEMQVQYYQATTDWTNFQPAVVAYMRQYGKNATPDQLNQFAWNVFENCSDMKCVGDALDWSKRSFKDNNNPSFMDTYANILYKMGQKEDAIAWEERALNLAEDKKVFQETLDKMKKGEKTWKN